MVAEYRTYKDGLPIAPYIARGVAYSLVSDKREK